MDMERELSLNMIEYPAVVQNIADGYFDEDGNYAPYYGKLNIVRLYYNLCVTKSKFDLPHNITDAAELDPLLEDEDFMQCLNDDLTSFGGYIGFRFADAYYDAMQIVKDRRSSVGRILTFAREAVEDLTTKMFEVLSQDNMDKLAKLGDALEQTKKDPAKIVQLFRTEEEPKKEE